MTNLHSGKERVAKSVNFVVVERERMAELIKFTFSALKPSPKSLSMPWIASTICRRLYITISYSICSSCIFTFLLCPPFTFALIQILQICRVLMPSCLSLFASIHSFIVTTTTQWHNHISQFTVLQFLSCRRARYKTWRDDDDGGGSTRARDSRHNHPHLELRQKSGIFSVVGSSVDANGRILRRRRWICEWAKRGKKGNKINFYREKEIWSWVGMSFLICKTISRTE